MSDRHGTLTMYIQGKCRCDRCRDHHSRHCKRYRLRKERGVSSYVDATPLKEHVRDLLERGMSFRAIALAAGWQSRNSLQTALNSQKVTRATLARVLAVQPASDNRDEAYIDATGSRRRLQALARMGWPAREIARRLGRSDKKGYANIANGTTTAVRRRTADDIARVYDELWDKQGPSGQTTERARARRWAPPLAWDDIDDPHEQPTGMRGPERTTRTRADLVEDYRDTLGHHGGDMRIAAERLGIDLRTLERALYRARNDGVDIPIARGRQVA